jgi:pimeloyl-ACP methyl ester carboxylesterase
VRAIAVSQRGHGDSDKPEAGYRIRDFAADLAGFFNALGLASAVIVGHSSHGLVAQRFALDHPSRTAGIVLESAFATLRGNPDAARFVASTGGSQGSVIRSARVVSSGTPGTGPP